MTSPVIEKKTVGKYVDPWSPEEILRSIDNVGKSNIHFSQKDIDSQYEVFKGLAQLNLDDPDEENVVSSSWVNRDEGNLYFGHELCQVADWEKPGKKKSTSSVARWV